MPSVSTYRTSVVAFLDVCGLKQRIHNSVEKPKLANRIERMLSELQNRCIELNKSELWGPEIPNLKARAFSDSIILTCPVAPDNPIVRDIALRKIALITSAYQMEVTQYDFFIRGAITVGLHCERGDVCFGPAFIEAYEAERRLAVWPRVIVLPKAIKLRAHGRHPYLKRDDAGITYVDYLLLCTSNLLIRRDNSKNKNVGLHPLSWLALMEKHKTALEASVKELNEASPEFLITLSKYHSLAYYHNSYLKQLISGSENFPLTQLLESVLSHKKGMTKDLMVREITEITNLFRETDVRLKDCLIDTRNLFAPLRVSGLRRNN